MVDLIERALTATRESKHVEFKQGFDTNLPQDWCEVIKDIVAIANSGGGVILFGLDNVGAPVGACLEAISRTDPADIGNKIVKYTGPTDLEFEIREVQKQGQRLVAFVIHAASIPVVFEKPGTYDIGGGKQRTAFSMGTVYFRHGAKSEPGTSKDIQQVVERQIEFIRKSWIKGVRKVVQAPPGSQIVAAHSRTRRMSGTDSLTMRAVTDPKAIPVFLTRNPEEATGSFVHEEVSEGIFDEINNVIDGNRALARGQQSFFFGQPVYYRIYAERHHVVQGDDNIALLFHSAVADFYAPALFWMLKLPERLIADTVAELFLSPTNPQIYCLIRIAVLLGEEFCQLLYQKWHSKWKRHPQPPSFYWSFRDMIGKIKEADPRVIAARLAPAAELSFPGEAPAPVKELLERPERAAGLLSLEFA
jgi:hypothetical protein